MLLHSLKNMFAGYRLSDWLPYQAYDLERKMYVNADATIGFALELAPMMFAGEQVINGLTSVLEQEWPKDSLVQISLYADPNMAGIIDGYATIRNRLLDVSDPREAFLYEWTSWQAAYLRVHRSRGLNEDVPVPFRNFRVFITAKIPCSRADAEGLSTRAADQLSVLRDNIMGMLRSNHVHTINVTPESLIRVLWQLWNPGHDFLERNAWDQRMPIREQIVAPDTEIVRRTRDNLVDGYRVAVKVPQVSPLTIMPMQTNLLLGDLFGSNLQ
ncbi:MAG: conjugal transfer protein TraC, partial [Bilophila sp.]